ncbi:MAG: glycosyltransferase, partial [Caldilineaceae bacterium]|nr:glycosyltransferase [Caldilineaceae bacterium]
MDAKFNRMPTAKKLQIVHLLSGDLWAGAESQTCALLRALATNDRYDLLVVLLNPGKLHDELMAAGVSVALIDESKLSFWQIRHQLRQLLAERHVDLIHAHRYKENTLAVLSRSVCGRPKLVQTVHGLNHPGSGVAGLRMRIYGLLNWALSRFSFDAIVAVSSDIAEVLSRRGLAGKVCTLRNGIDPLALDQLKPDLTLRQELGVAQSDLLVGVCGRFVPVKRYDLF